MKVKALKDFTDGGKLRFSKNDVLSVKEYGERYFLIPKKKLNKILIPVGVVREATEEEIKEAEEKEEEKK